MSECFDLDKLNAENLPPYLPFHEAARYLAVSIETVRYLANRGKLTTHRFSGTRSVCITKESLLRCHAERRAQLATGKEATR